MTSEGLWRKEISRLAWQEIDREGERDREKTEQVSAIVHVVS